MPPQKGRHFFVLIVRGISFAGLELADERIMNSWEEAGGPTFDLVSIACKAGAPFFAQFAKGGNHERLHQCLGPQPSLANQAVFSHNYADSA
jgi:hypothetical protein